ncbi:HupE/UreJ family protein [Sulfitobacter brevis]|uniref:HupE/UreJ family protein n=1 Tax=Sulfitobacter brevis TaxID=74348 RepID=UPI000B89F9F9|nr:HupE/UreJ family protein [Sulfitobacter brevis]
MTKTFIGTLRRLALWASLSSVLAVASQAHEVQPTIGDLTVADGKAELVLRINLEAFLSGIDLDEIADTNNAENAEDYDALRELSAEEIEARAPGLLKGWNTLPLIEVDGTPVPLQSISVAVPRDVNIESPRVAEWRLAGDVAQGASQVIVRWPDGAGAMVLRQQGVEEPFTGYLDGGQTSEAIALGGGGQQSTLQAFVTYIPIGFDHILPKGLDHILFVLGLFLLSTHLRPLLWQVSAFTLAHTVTLALGAMGWVTVPAAIVEPLIAASIVFVAVENIYSSGLSRWRPLVVFGFGLLHGLGFASVLGEFGLPEGQFLPALIGFNVGVEFGQLTVIAVAAVLIWLALQAARASKLQGDEIMIQEREVLFRAVSITGSLIIALIGAYWVVERVFL